MVRGEEIKTGYIAENAEKLRRIVSHFNAHLGLRPQFSVCNAPWISAVVEADGEVRPCFFHHTLGNVHQRSLQDIVNGEAAISFRRSLDMRATPHVSIVCALYITPQPTKKAMKNCQRKTDPRQATVLVGSAHEYWNTGATRYDGDSLRYPDRPGYATVVRSGPDVRPRRHCHASTKTPISAWRSTSAVALSSFPCEQTALVVQLRENQKKTGISSTELSFSTKSSKSLDFPVLTFSIRVSEMSLEGSRPHGSPTLFVACIITGEKQTGAPECLCGAWYLPGVASAKNGA